MQFTVIGEISLSESIIKASFEVPDSISKQDIDIFILKYKDTILHVYKFGGQKALNKMVSTYIDIITNQKQ